MPVKPRGFTLPGTIAQAAFEANETLTSRQDRELLKTVRILRKYQVYDVANLASLLQIAKECLQRDRH